MKLITSVIVLWLVMLPLFVLAQVSGTVYENSNNMQKPLYGVNIYWENTNIGTTSDKDGKFKITQATNSTNLVFSFVGYRADTIKIETSNQSLDIILRDSRFLDEVTIGERKVGTHYSRVETGSVQNITGEELCKAACCNLSESFETNASVDASYSDATTGAKQIKLLGLAGKYVQMMTENIPNLYGVSQPYALGYIPGPWMESIPVSKGTSAVINGYDAVTGQINVEYKKPKTSDLLYFNQLVSSAGKVETNLDVSFILSPKLSTTFFVHTQFDQIKIDENNDNFIDMPMINQYNFFNRWDYFDNNISVRFGVKYIDETRRGGQIDHIYGNNLDATNPYGIFIGSKRIESFLKTGYVFPNKKYMSIAMITNFTGHRQNSYYGHNNYDADQISGYYNIIWQSAFKGNLNHKYNTGTSLKYEDLNQVLNDSIITDLELVPGVFFQYTGKVFEKMNIIVGARADYHNQFGLLFTPRVNMKYNLLGNVTLRASAGKGYRKANVLAENSFLLASSREISIANNLKLEEAWNYGGNITWYIPIGDRDMAVNVEFYRTDFTNQIIADFETVGSVEFYNLDGKSYSNTYQIEATYQLIKGLDITTAYRYNDVKQTIAGKLVESPLTNKYKGLISMSYKTPLEKWQFDFTTQFNGGGRIPSTLSNPSEYQLAESYNPYTIFNAQITKYFKHWEIYLGSENISNFKQASPIVAAHDPFGNYFDSSLIWGPVHGRKFYLGVRFTINKKEK